MRGLGNGTYITIWFAVLVGVAAPLWSFGQEELVQLTVAVVEGGSEKQVRDASVDVISTDEPEKFSMKSSKTDGKGTARFRIPRGNVVVQVNAQAHDPKAVQVVVGKDAGQSVKIVLEKREAKKKK